MVKLNPRERNCSYMHEKWIREDVSASFNWWIACLLAKQPSLLQDSIFHPVCGLLSKSLAFPAVCETSAVWLVITIKCSFCLCKSTRHTMISINASCMCFCWAASACTLKEADSEIISCYGVSIVYCLVSW